MLNYEADPLSTELDAERRRQLRAFLIDFRSRLAPDEVGLPRTSRRRVAGLRREEVAELIGVTADWYRSFESGRAVRVSPQFVSRLSNVLRLPSDQQMNLFRLSFLEIYQI
jgi:hypothetical protein